MYFKLPAIREDVFIWLNDIESRMQHDESNHNIKEGINSLILNYFPRLVDMDSSQAIKLVEQWFMEED
jgi:predicted component of type VI protein secretion system